jgi:type I restriction enzyme R subunit
VSSAESAWRQILEYFDSAVHIGMTATPQRKNTVDDTFRYFGKPVYEYSLRQGIEDGFLAPFLVDRRLLDIDLSGYVPQKNDVDNNGNPLDKPLYTMNDFDRIMTVKKRQEEVAKYIMDHLNSTDKYDKTIVFCQGSRHAAQMVELLNNLARDNAEYCVRIVADEGEIGKKFLDKFSNPKEKFPIIAVTSRLMSTGIDAPTCRNIVIDRIINSMTEFKQIIGRGTRVYELQDKLWFTIIDFRGATELFDDPDWDGPGLPPPPPKKGTPTGPREPKPERPWLEIDGDKVQVIGRYVRIFDPAAENGHRLLSFEQFTANTVKRLESDFDMELKQIWSDIDKRKHFVQELERRGITITHIQQIMENYDADVFDILLNLAYGKPIKTRRQRVEGVRRKKTFLEKNPEKAREILDVLMDHYAEVGYQELEPNNTQVLRLAKFNKFGGDYAIVNNVFRGIDNYNKTLDELVHQIYEA